MPLTISMETVFILWTAATFLLAGGVGYLVNLMNDRMNPDDPYEFLKKYLGKPVEYNHKYYKMMVKGRIAGISLGKGGSSNKGGGKSKPNYIVMIIDGEYKHPVSLYDEGKTWKIVK